MRGPDAVRVVLAGDIDTALVDALDAATAVVEEHRLPVMVDATAVTFMDSRGARFLSRCYVRGPMTVAASPPVRFLLTVLAMDDVLTGADRSTGDDDGPAEP
ncbi:STAS domain-containing protein [Cellulomonas sp. 179-A 4D5 NHS]|uniref:STAS domain-containing protein n=1 Tax=Cellulomonas sp. 179-A 4D5 NHS TaxID=3142378 RepID=UPI0039A253B5